MGRDDVARKVAERLAMPACRVRAVLDALLDVKAEVLLAGSPVHFEEFGVYSVKRSAAHAIGDPNTGKRVVLPERLSVKFRASRRLGARLNATPAALERTLP